MLYRQALRAIFNMSSARMPQGAEQLRRRATSPSRLLFLVGVALCAALSAPASGKALPPPPPHGATAVALLYIPGAPAAREPQSAAPGPHDPDGATSHDGSHIPTPVDNPWALSLLAALAARMLWMDWRSKRNTG